jgi:hypothetical protein
MSRCGRGIGRVGGGGWVVWPLSVSAERSFASGKCRIRQVIGVKVDEECVYQTNLTFVVELIHHQSPALSEISAYIAAELPTSNSKICRPISQFMHLILRELLHGLIPCRGLLGSNRRTTCTFRLLSKMK